MADTTTTTYGLTKPEVGASEDTWGEKLNTNLDSLDDLLSGGITLQGAKLDDTTKIVDNIDATKIVALSAGSITTATTRTFTFPDATGTFVLADNTATLTNKTLTSPAINTGFTFDGTTVTALSGADTTVVTGTAGTSGNAAVWNADGDVVDGGVVPSAGGLIFIESQDASASTTLDFTSFNASLYDSYVFKFMNILTGADAGRLEVRTSTNGGSTYDSGASDYTYAYQTSEHTSGDTTGGNGSIGNTSIQVISNIGTAAGEFGASGTLNVHGAHLAAKTVITFDSVHQNFAGAIISQTGGGTRQSAADVDAIRFLNVAGTFASGTITMYGLRNS
jgi:hypothetical protein